MYKAWGPVEKRYLANYVTVSVTKTRIDSRPHWDRTAESMMPRPLYGRRTSFKPSHTSPDIIRRWGSRPIHEPTTSAGTVIGFRRRERRERSAAAEE